MRASACRTSAGSAAPVRGWLLSCPFANVLVRWRPGWACWGCDQIADRPSPECSACGSACGTSRRRRLSAGHPEWHREGLPPSLLSSTGNCKVGGVVGGVSGAASTVSEGGAAEERGWAHQSALATHPERRGVGCGRQAANTSKRPLEETGRRRRQRRRAHVLRTLPPSAHLACCIALAFLPLPSSSNGGGGAAAGAAEWGPGSGACDVSTEVTLP